MARPTLLNLETALWVERIGTFSGAARKLNATQPAISLRVKELETSLGFKVFVRRGHRMLPTAEGREFLERVAPLINELHTTLGEAGSETSSVRVVRIGSGQAGMIWLGEVIGQLMANDSSLRFEITVSTFQALLSKLEQEKLDLVVLPRSVDYPNLTCTTLGRMKMIWVMSPERWERYASYPRQRDPSLVDLLNTGPIWMPPNGTPYSNQQAEVLSTHGCTLKNVSWCADISKLGPLVLSTGGIARLPVPLVAHWLDSGALVEVPGLGDEAQDAVLFAAWRRTTQSPIYRRIVQLAKAQCELNEEAQNTEGNPPAA